MSVTRAGGNVMTLTVDYSQCVSVTEKNLPFCFPTTGKVKVKVINNMKGTTATEMRTEDFEGIVFLILCMWLLATATNFI